MSRREEMPGYVQLPGPQAHSTVHLSAVELRANFWWMSVCFAVNHGCVTTPLVVSTTVLGSEVASVGNGILYSMTIFASLFVAAPMINALGAKASLLCSMFLYCIYALDFMLAVIFKDVAAVSWAAFAVGSVCGGLAAGAMWTAQGSYFSSTATLLAAAEDQPRTAATASLAGNFAFMYLSCEVGSKLGYSALQQFGVEPWAIGLVYVGLGALAWVAMFWVTSLEVDGQTVNPLSKAGVGGSSYFTCSRVLAGQSTSPPTGQSSQTSLQTSLTGCTLASIVLVLAALTPVSYACARWVRRQRLRRLAKEEKLRALQEPDREEQCKCSRDMGA